MSQTLKISNYGDANTLETTHLTADAASGQAVIAVENNQNFTANSHYVLGRVGGESLEKLVVSSVSGTTGITATANMANDHKKYDEVTRLFGDQMRVYRAPNVDGTAPADGSFAVIATKNIDYDQSDTKYTDSSGSDSYWYKAVYYDSVGDEITPLAASVAFRGGGYGNYASLESIRRKAGLQDNRWISDSVVEEKRQAAQELINSTLTGRYTIPFSKPINALIAEITRLLAAGYLLTQEYDDTSTSTFTEGQAMIERVTNDKGTGILDKLNTGTMTLLGETDATLETSTSINYAGWPDSTTKDAVAADGGGDRKIRVSDVY